MVQFVGARQMAELVRRTGLAQTYRGLVACLEADFRRWEVFEKAARIASHSADGVIELMPTRDPRTYSVKYVNGHPKNPAGGLQTVTAFGLLADVETGYPVFLADMTIATALRTAATSAMAAKYLARRDPRAMALIGLGAQAEFQAHAFHAILGIRHFRVFDIDGRAVEKFTRNLSGSGLDIQVAGSPETAVIGVDIITTVTADKRKARILSDNMVGAGMHLNAVGGDCPGKTELQRDILLRSEIFVEFLPQTRIEGEIQQLAGDAPATELWEVIAGRHRGRTSDDQITLFDSVGFAIEDFSALRYLQDLAGQTGLGIDIDLIAEPHDPRDLFGLLLADAG